MEFVSRSRERQEQILIINNPAGWRLCWSREGGRQSPMAKRVYGESGQDGILAVTSHLVPLCPPADIRETAFVYAITAAGVSHAITQACSMGELLQCGCELTRSRAPPSPTAGPGTEGTAWEWGGCGDDVQFGYEKSQQFMDAKSKKGKNDIRALIDLHNNEAGRLVRLHALPAPSSIALHSFG